MTHTILNWIYASPVSHAIRSYSGLFLVIRFSHFVAMMFLVVSISKVDLRLMGLAEKRTPVTELIAEILPWTWRAFFVAAMTGSLLFISNAPVFYGNESFRLKILLIALAGVNMALFHWVAYRGVAAWDSDGPTVFSAKLAGALSLALWIAVALLGFRTVFTAGH